MARLHQDQLVSLSISIDSQVTDRLVMDALARFKDYIGGTTFDVTEDWFIQSSSNTVEILLPYDTVHDFPSHEGNQAVYRILGWMECWLASKKILHTPSRTKFGGCSPFNTDAEYIHYSSGRVGKLYQTVTGILNIQDHRDGYKPYVKVQNWHGDQQLNTFCGTAQRYASLVDPYAYIDHVYEECGRELYNGELNTVFRKAPGVDVKELESWTTLKHGPINTKNWYTYCQEQEELYESRKNNRQ